jgi:thymidylate kinase
MKHALYVFEGVDGSGKTELSQAFAEKINGVYYKGLPRRIAWLKPLMYHVPGIARYWYFLLGNYISAVEIKRLLEKSPVVVDQYIYCTAAFHSVSLSKNILLADVTVLPDQIFYLYASWQKIDDRLEKRDHRNKFEKLTYLKKVDEVYRNIFSTVKENVTYIDTTTGSVEENLSLLKQTL